MRVGERFSTPHPALIRLSGFFLAAAAVLAVIRPVPVRAAPSADQATDDFNLGVGFYRDQRWQLAASTFDQFIRDYPSHPRINLARVYLGLAYSSLNEYDKARVQFNESLRVEPEGPNAADVRYRLGECSYYLKEYDLAIRQLTDYLQQHPEHSLNDWATLFIGDAHNERNDPQSAETVLRALLNSAPDPAVVSDARFGLARALEAQGNSAEAFALYRDVAEDDASIFAARALSRIGAMYFRQQQYADAAGVYDDIVQRFPASSQARNAVLNAGLAFYRSNNYEDALQRLETIPAESPLFAQSVVLKAMCLKSLDRPAEARTAFNDALAAAGETPLAADILFQKAQLERREGLQAEAARIFEDLADRWPEDERVPDCLFNAVDLRLELQDVSRAQRLWNRLATDLPEYAARPRSQILRGRLQLAQQDVEGAAQTLSQVVADLEDPAARDGAVARYLLARTHFEAGAFGETIELTRQLLPLTENAQYAEVRDVLVLGAVAAANSGRHQDARQFADAYLSQPTSEAQRADALSARTMALAGLGEYAASVADARTLAAEFASRGESWNAILAAANLAREASAWTEAEQLYRVAAEDQQTPSIREPALTGIAVCLYRSADYERARQAFADAIAVSTTPDSEAQLRYLMADSVAQAGQQSEAVALYHNVFTRFAPADATAAADLPDSSRLRYAYDAGKQSARLAEQTGDAERADEIWRQITEAFPEADDADAVLDEWAHMNLQHERYDEADDIHRRLLKAFPESEFAGTARLSLAESAVLGGERQHAIAEFQAILDEPRFGELEKSSALFHLLDIAVADGEWTTAKERADRFRAEYAQHKLLPRVQLFLAEAELNLGNAARAEELARPLQQQLESGAISLGLLAERVWLILARAALESGRYAEVDPLAAEMEQRYPESRFAFQMRDLQGRRWLLQAPPDFEQARAWFQQVVEDPYARGTRTAASCQLRIADTYRRQDSLSEAVREYYRLYYNHSGNDDLRVEALYAAAVCERDLKETDSAIRSLRDLISRFPDSARRKDAERELAAMGASPRSAP